MSKFSIETRVNDEMLKEMIEIDKMFFTGDDIGVFDKCKEWIKINPDIYTVLLFEGRVIGCINFMPITDKAYKLFKQGKLKDYELKREDVVQFKSKEPLKCLLTGIAIIQEYQDCEAVKILWSGLLNKLKAFNVTISGVVADCVSKQGEKFVKQRLDAKFIINSNNGKIYEGNSIIDAVDSLIYFKNFLIHHGATCR